MQLTDYKAIVIDATGTELTKEEQALFRAEKPAGFILFKRNCVSKQQVRELVASVRECVGWENLPVLIDQEGGTVSRLKQPEWQEYPAAKIFGELASSSEQEGLEATRINSYLMALDLADLGITVNCAPVMDVPAPECHEFLSGSRTYSESPEAVAHLGEAVCRGLLDGGVTPVIKHIPGHGRAKVDSHHALPTTDASLSDLSKTDLKPFKYIAQTDMKTAVWAMAAHVVFSSIDPDSAASVSGVVVDGVIRKEIGFDGVLLADDISMKALGGSLESKVKDSIAAGMDLTMLCNASFDDREQALNHTPKLSEVAAQRVGEAERQRTAWLKKGNDNREELLAKLEQMIEKRRIG